MIAQPDCIFYQDTGQLLMAIEVKTKWVLSSADLVRKYNDDVSALAQHRSLTNSVHLPVQQIFVYLSSNNLRYGVLTTYEQTWF
ncbi:hypothetical protein BC939DRAFT_445123 [Gamsiella multidivaricata]|uniref:uncharacterized protein n=1 Tax=Gamsiella multidivaricata TaxID=101098 RepID=UPI0022207E41|nr:uncharacterized protein BC939DRAFT_445123 [Gamsiella multidivaricata]KAI7827407.1 hypothetical protein BC939DRAFT_445123 [Gamsiella multidivaricata]